MSDKKYEVIIDNDIIVSDLSIESMLIMVKAIFEEFFPKKGLTVSIKEMDMKKSIANTMPRKKGQWLRLSDLSEQADDRYSCSHCGAVVHHKNKKNLYTFNSWCGRCGSYNGSRQDG